MTEAEVKIKNKTLDEVIAKAKYVAKVCRTADPKLFPTMVIRAEALESFIETLEDMRVKSN